MTDALRFVRPPVTIKTGYTYNGGPTTVITTRIPNSGGQVVRQRIPTYGAPTTIVQKRIPGTGMAVGTRYTAGQPGGTPVLLPGTGTGPIPIGPPNRASLPVGIPGYRAPLPVPVPVPVGVPGYGAPYYPPAPYSRYSPYGPGRY